MDFESYISDCARCVDEALQERLSAMDIPSQLRAAMTHLLFPGGKRLRPTLVFAVCEALGKPRKLALPGAEAVELLHTYSLIHDDLPCMDDDDRRRGRPTVHKVHGEALAVLAGDALQALAFEVLACVGEAWASDAIKELAETAGARCLVGGQSDDLEFEPDDLSLEIVDSVHRRKSAALFGTSASLGAWHGGACEEQRESLRRFGEMVGRAFQVADDLVDSEDLESCSILRVIDRQDSEIRMQAHIDAALLEVESMGDAGEKLCCFAHFVARGKM